MARPVDSQPRPWHGLRLTFEGGFSRRARHLGLLYIAVALPLVTLVGSFAHGQSHYLWAFVLASKPFTTLALLVSWRAVRRSPPNDRIFWALWFAGTVLVYLLGLAILVNATTDWQARGPGAEAVVALGAVLFTVAIVGLVRSRSGRRALSVDLAEWLTATVVVVAPCILLWGDRVVAADDAWFAVPAGMSAIGMVSGCYWASVLTFRIGPERCAAEPIGLALCLCGVVNGIAQMAQGVSGFALPSGPLIATQATCTSLLFLVPLYMPRKTSHGLSRLPPQAQVRSGGLAAVITLAGVPVLLLVTLAVQDQHPWATNFTLGTLIVLLLLAAVRQLAAVRETRRLYARVERASEDRRELLARMIQRTDDDRHRVASQLHEQAISAYATFVSFIQTTQRAPGSPAASDLIREDLAHQAESLRQLMLAIRPLEAESRGAQSSIQAPIQAYLDGLYRDLPAPELDVSVDEVLVLGWITETLVLRIVQEAIRNVWSHSEASRVVVSLRADGPVAEVRIEDDGIGFDPTTSLFESGIAAMRGFAGVGGGTLRVESAPGEGTTVIARLSDDPSASKKNPSDRAVFLQRQALTTRAGRRRTRK